MNIQSTDEVETTALESSDCRNGSASSHHPKHARPHASRKGQFDEIRALFEGGSTVSEISRKLGLGLRRVHRWVCRIDFPERSVMAPKPSTPAYSGTFLAASWAQGTTKVRHLFSDIRHRGYTGSYSHLAGFLAPWRKAAVKRGTPDDDVPAPRPVPAMDSMTGRHISSVIAAALCVKPRGQMTDRQLANIDVLKLASPDFCTMRQLALRLRGLLRGGTVDALDKWVTDARSSNIHGMRRFARTLRQDMTAVSNAVLEPWSNRQAEGQINRSKMLKRAVYGRAGIELLRARMLPLE